MNETDRLLNQLHTLLEVASKMDSRRKCRKCGKPAELSMSFCSVMCKDKFHKLSFKSQIKKKINRLKVPHLCPVCQKKPIKPGMSTGIFCTDCGYTKY